MGHIIDFFVHFKVLTYVQFIYAPDTTFDDYRGAKIVKYPLNFLKVLRMLSKNFFNVNCANICAIIQEIKTIRRVKLPYI